MDASIERAREATALLARMRALLREQEERAAAAAVAAAKPVENGIPVTCPCGADIENADRALQKMKKKMRAMRRGRI